MRPPGSGGPSGPFPRAPTAQKVYYAPGHGKTREGPPLTVREISIRADDRPGSLAALTRILANHGINIIALSLHQSEVTGIGVIRVVTNRPDITIDILREAGYELTISELLPIKLVDKPGSLAVVADILAKHNINIDYGYTLITRPSEKAILVAHVSDVQKAVEVLREAGVRLSTAREHTDAGDDQTLAELKDEPDDYMLDEIDDLVYFMRED